MSRWERILRSNSSGRIVRVLFESAATIFVLCILR
jgi:hypothetical protein